MSLKSLKRHEGYLLIDNRVSEGVSDQMAVTNGLPVGAGRGLFEAATYTCNHCEAIVVIEPKRTRERGYCRGCDHMICDSCAFIRSQTHECVTMQRLIDQKLSEVEKQTSQSSPILLPT